MAAKMLAQRVDEGLIQRYSELAERTNRPRSFYVNLALEEAIDDLEFIYDLKQQSEDWRAGRLETYSLDEVRAHCGLDD